MKLVNTMDKVSAVSVGSEVASMLEENQSTTAVGRVHSVFSKGINILFSNGKLVSFVKPIVGQGPFNVVASLPYYTTFDDDGFDRLRVGQNLYARRDYFQIEDFLRIGTKGSQIYVSKHDFASKPYQLPSVEENLTRMTRFVRERGRSWSLGVLGKALTEKSRLSIIRLLKSVENNNTERVKKSASALVGLGPGLTPAIDDLLSGFMLSYYLFTENLNKSELETARKMNELIAIYSNQTSILSAQQLKQAAIGNGTEVEISVVQSLLTSQNRNNDRNKKNIEHSTLRLICVGATSGTCTALGIILGSKLALKLIYVRNGKSNKNKMGSRYHVCEKA